MKDPHASRMIVALLETVVAVAGIALIVLGIWDIFLTILHPDRDGPASVALNRVTWRAAVGIARRVPGSAREVAALAGAIMIAGTILLWMALQVLGFALLAWPFLDSGFSTPYERPGFIDALYWSGVTFTTLGYGDVIPVTPLWKLVALAEAVAGFALVGAAVTFLLSVFQGVDLRDKMALRIYSETRRTWDGATFVLRILVEEGEERLLGHLFTWADQMRSLHERLYRFQPLAFYVRTRSEKHDPERMLEAVAEVALAAALLARVTGHRGLRPAADELDIAYTEFALSALRHHGTRRAVRAVERPEPTEEDRASLLAIWNVIQRELRVPGLPWDNARDERDLMLLAARLRIFLAELDRITRWKSIPGV